MQIIRFTQLKTNLIGDNNFATYNKHANQIGQQINMQIFTVNQLDWKIKSSNEIIKSD